MWWKVICSTKNFFEIVVSELRRAANFSALLVINFFFSRLLFFPLNQGVRIFKTTRSRDRTHNRWIYRFYLPGHLSMSIFLLWKFLKYWLNSILVHYTRYHFIKTSVFCMTKEQSALLVIFLLHCSLYNWHYIYN